MKKQRNSQRNIKSSSPKLLLFDLDGTLLLTGGAGLRTMKVLFKKLYGIPDGMDGVDGRGVTDPKIFAAIIEKKLGRPAKKSEIAKIIKMYPRYLAHQVRSSRGYRLMAGVHKLLQALQRIPGVYLALGTGNLEKAARIKLERGKLNRYFPVGGFSSDSIDRAKLIAAARRKAERYYKVKFKPSQVYVIGDTHRDIHAGKANKFKTVAVGCGMFSKRRLLAAHPNFYFNHLKHPQPWIQHLNLKK